MIFGPSIQDRRNLEQRYDAPDIARPRVTVGVCGVAAGAGVHRPGRRRRLPGRTARRGPRRRGGGRAHPSIGGRQIRLAGIERIRPDRASGRAALSAMVVGRDVKLRGEDDTPDRYGRQAAFVFASSSEHSVQTELLRRGEALVSTDISDKNCLAVLAAAERAARDSKLGIWAEAAAIKNTESPGDILAAIGQFTVVEGRVLSVRQAGSITYLNFGRNWTRDFAATIPRRIIPAFESAGLGPKSFENRRIRVRGVVSSRGGPRIEVLRVGQIEVLGGK